MGNISEHAGDFRFEPEIWIGFAVNTSEVAASTSSPPINVTHKYEHFEQHVGRCIHYETNYTLEFVYTDHTCHMKPAAEFMEPILGFNFSHHNDGVLPKDRWLSPRHDGEAYLKTAAYHAIGHASRRIIQGELTVEISITDGQYLLGVGGWSEAVGTPLLTTNGEAPPDMLQRLENWYQGIVFSFLTQSNMTVNTVQEVPVRWSRYRIAFVYDSVRLWICYAPVIFLTLTILIMGAWTIREDGMTFSTGFSRILATTRNSTLDKISKGACLGNDPFPQELMRRKLRFGALRKDAKSDDTGYELVDGGGYGHCAFGLPSEVGPIRKGMLYAGLEIPRTSQYRPKVKTE